MGTVTDVLAVHERTLADAGVDTPAVDVRLLAAHSLAVPHHRVRSALPGATPEQLAALEQLVARRAQRVPVQHLTGRAPFRYLDLLVRPGVFVPRPETEVLVGIGLDLLRRGRGATTRTVIEPCTGTGAVGLALATEQPGVRVISTEASPTAVALARENLARVEDGHAGVDGLAAGSSVEIRRGDLLSPVPASLRGAVDLLIGNPPYLPEAARTRMPPEVTDHDPHGALFGGPDGYEVVDRLVAAAGQWLVPGGWLVLEIDDRRGEAAARCAEAAGLEEVRVAPDLTGRDRVLVARRPGGER